MHIEVSLRTNTHTGPPISALQFPWLTASPTMQLTASATKGGLGDGREDREGHRIKCWWLLSSLIKCIGHRICITDLKDFGSYALLKPK